MTDNPPVRPEEQALKASLLGALLLAVWGLVMAAFASSGAIMLDGMFNLISAIMTFFSIKVARLVSEPKSRSFPVGYFAFESLFVLVKGASILVLVVMAVAMNVMVLLAGGREPKLGLMTIYVGIAVIGCIILTLITRKAFKQTGLDILKAETNAWMVNAAISSAIGVAFLVTIFLQGTSLGWIDRYMDQILVIVLGMFALRDPAVLIRDGFRELMLAAPADRYVKPLEEKLLPLKEELDLKDIAIEVLKTGRRMWVTIRACPLERHLDLDAFMETRRELKALVLTVYENSDTEIILDCGT